MNPGIYNFTRKIGATWFLRHNWAAGDPPVTVNLAGYTGKLIVRYKPESPNVLLEVSTTNGRLVLNGAPYNIVGTVPRDVTALLPPGNFFYDLELSSAGGIDYPILTGRFEFLPTGARP